MDLTVYTYGGGEILRMIFNAIASITKGGLFNSLMVIFASFGAFWVVVTTFFSGKIEAIILQFFFPALLVSSLLMLPKTTVHIEDAFVKIPYKVDNVPWLLGFPVQLISSLGYKITDAIETSMHLPNDIQYNKTGMIFGSETALDMKKFRITNPILEQNLKHFAKQCVFYDLALRKYSLDDLKKTGDLWGFLSENTSIVRMIPYTDPQNTKIVTYKTCKNAIGEMKPIFEAEKNYYALQDIGKNLPLTYQALTSFKKEKEELISQQLVMNYLDGELGSENFAKSRAYMQQKSTYQILGSLASSSLVTMRAILEAIIYASVIFIIPLSVLPGGFKYIYNWAWMLIWIQLWPPFYAIANYILQIIAQQKAAVIFSSLKETQQGLSFFTNAGLANLYDDMFAMSGYLMTMVPFLSYAMVKGGINSIIHMAGSLMSPSQSAAGSAAAEQVSGNYNFGNSTFGQTTYDNTSAMQHNLAPSLSSGHFTDNHGGMTTQYTDEGVFVSQNNSKFRFDASSDNAITESVQMAYQDSVSFAETKQKSYSESLASQGRWMSDLSSHLSQSQNFSEGISSREAMDFQESTRYVTNKVESLAQQHGVSFNEAYQATLGGSVLLAGANKQMSDSESAFYTDAINLGQSEDFATNHQKVIDFAKTQAQTDLSDEGIRLADGFSRSVDESRSSQEQFSAAYHRSQQLSETNSWVEHNAHVLKESLNQDLFNWATCKLGYDEAKDILAYGNHRQKTELFNEYIASDSFMNVVSEHSFEKSYENHSINSLNKEYELDNLYSHSTEQAALHGLQKGFSNEKRDELEVQHEQFNNSYGSEIKQFNKDEKLRMPNEEGYNKIKHRLDTYNKVQETAVNLVMSGLDACGLDACGHPYLQGHGSLAWNSNNAGLSSVIDQNIEEAVK